MGTSEKLLTTDTVRLYSGKYVNVAEFKESDINILDIAWGLSMKPRFNGHIQTPYSIASHSMFVAELCAGLGIHPLWGLFHDSSEAYVFDVPTPMKKQLPDLVAMENKIQNTVYEYFFGRQIIKSEYKILKQADHLALSYEWDTYVLNRCDVLSQRHEYVRFVRMFMYYFKNLKTNEPNPKAYSNMRRQLVNSLVVTDKSFGDAGDRSV